MVGNPKTANALVIAVPPPRRLRNALFQAKVKTAIWTHVAAMRPTKDGEGFSDEIPPGVSV